MKNVEFWLHADNLDNIVKVINNLYNCSLVVFHKDTVFCLQTLVRALSVWEGSTYHHHVAKTASGEQWHTESPQAGCGTWRLSLPTLEQYYSVVNTLDYILLEFNKLLSHGWQLRFSFVTVTSKTDKSGFKITFGLVRDLAFSILLINLIKQYCLFLSR